MEQLAIFNNMARRPFPRRYSNVLTVSINRKGVMDVDTVKGCSVGMATYPKGGCYGECYAYKNARTYGFDFRTSVSRQFMGREHKGTLIKMMLTYPVGWYRIGTAKEKQDYLLSLAPVIDNPLRARKENSRVVAGDVILARRGESVGGGKYVSVNSSDAYLGTCRDCPDQCGVDSSAISNMEKENKNEGRTSRTLPFEN
jgi:hypothetical protein